MPDLDPLAANAQAARAFWDSHRPPDTDGRSNQIASVEASAPGPGVTVRADFAVPAPAPSLIVSGGDADLMPSDFRVRRVGP